MIYYQEADEYTGRCWKLTTSRDITPVPLFTPSGVAPQFGVGLIRVSAVVVVTESFVWVPENQHSKRTFCFMFMKGCLNVNK